MALFKQPDPEVVLKHSLADERALHRQLEARLVSARKTATDCQIAARNATRTLADDKIDALEQREIAAERRVSNLFSEITDSDSRLADLETQLAGAVDQRIRRATAREIEIIAEGFAAAADNTVKALAALVLQTEKMITFMPDAQGLHQFASRVQGELPDNIRMLTGLISSYAAGVLAGGFAATLPQPAPAPASLPKPAAPVVQVTVLKYEGVGFFDAAGNVETGGRGEDVNLSPQTAKRAIASNAVCAMNDPRRKQIRQNFGISSKPSRKTCVWLEDGDMPPDPQPLSDRRVVEPIKFAPAPLPPGFERLPVGPPRKVQVEGARNLDIVARNNSREADEK